MAPDFVKLRGLFCGAVSSGYVLPPSRGNKMSNPSKAAPASASRVLGTGAGAMAGLPRTNGCARSAVDPGCRLKRYGETLGPLKISAILTGIKSFSPRLVRASAVIG